MPRPSLPSVRPPSVRPPSVRPPTTPAWRALADDQQGVVSRGQLLALGLTHAQAHQNVDNRRWRTLLPGVYATFTGPVSPVARVWAAVLYAGTGAVASHSTALWLVGVLNEPTRPIHVGIGHRRRVRPQPGVRIHRSSALDLRAESVVHPAASPPRMRVEVALLDQTSTATDVAAIDLALRAIQRRLTTAARLRAALDQRPGHRWRHLLLEVLAEAAQGVASPLERHYLRDVERVHRLPVGVRNLQEATSSGGHRYRDVRYAAGQLVVELDGREAHPADGAFRDLRRDNLAVVAGESVLRYGWRDVVGSPCEVAAQVAGILRSRGWTARPASCGPSCAVGSAA